MKNTFEEIRTGIGSSPLGSFSAAAALALALAGPPDSAQAQNPNGPNYDVPMQKILEKIGPEIIEIWAINEINLNSQPEIQSMVAQHPEFQNVIDEAEKTDTAFCLAMTNFIYSELDQKNRRPTDDENEKFAFIASLFASGKTNFFDQADLENPRASKRTTTLEKLTPEQKDTVIQLQADAQYFIKRIWNISSSENAIIHSEQEAAKSEQEAAKSEQKFKIKQGQSDLLHKLYQENQLPAENQD